MATQKTNNSAKKSVQTEPSPTRKNELTTSTQKYAQMLTFRNYNVSYSRTYQKVHRRHILNTQKRNLNHT